KVSINTIFNNGKPSSFCPSGKGQTFRKNFFWLFGPVKIHIFESFLPKTFRVFCTEFSKAEKIDVSLRLPEFVNMTLLNPVCIRFVDKAHPKSSSQLSTG